MTISEQTWKEYYDHSKRHIYITPKIFLSFIQEYMKVYIRKMQKYQLKKPLLIMGLLTEAEKNIYKKS